MITFDQKLKQFHLTNGRISYYFYVNKEGYLIHLYYGEYLSEIINVERINERYAERYAYLKDGKEVCDESTYFSMLSSNFECATFQMADTRGAYSVIEHTDKGYLTAFKYESHKIINGKLNSETMPHVKLNSQGEAETLIVTLKDIILG